MLGFEKDGEFLDLSPGTAAQIERQSPFFNSNDLAAEYSLPLTFPYTPKNARLLGLPNHYYTRRIKTKLSGWRMYDNNNFSYTGELLIEAADLNVNDVTKSKITGYFLTGVSSFFTAIKNKKLKELYLGGIRNFAWTNNDPNSSLKGFWQHVHDSLVGNMEYSFAPIRNEKWAGSSEDDTPDWMNKLDNLGNIDYNSNYNTLAPQVSLKYLLEQIFSEHGWDFDYSGMNDEQWKTLFMPSFYAVSWQKIVQIANDPFFMYAPLSNIKMNLQQHVPPEMNITDLIIDLRNRYNWGFDFDSTRKICYLFPLKNLANGKRKDWTDYMDPSLHSDFSEDEKIYAFRNDIDNKDGLSSSPDLTNIQQLDPVMEFSEMPAADESNFNYVIYVWKLNQYYQCHYDEDNRVYNWDIYANGIYNYEPDGNNEEMATAASTMPVYRTLYRSNGVTDFYGLFPLCEQEGNWEGKKGDFIPWGLRLLFNRGKVWEANPEGNKGQIQYPYLTSICFTPTQEEPDLIWSNVYKHEFGDVDKGIINYWWKETLKYLAQSEIHTGVLNLPRQELVNFSWSDVILLRNVPFIMQKVTDVIPFTGRVNVELRRIG